MRCSKQPAAEHYPEQDESNPQHSNLPYFFKRNFKIILPSWPKSLKRVLFHRVLRQVQDIFFPLEVSCYPHPIPIMENRPLSAVHDLLLILSRD
jgi:hypothetical protein